MWPIRCSKHNAHASAYYFCAHRQEEGIGGTSVAAETARGTRTQPNNTDTAIPTVGSRETVGSEENQRKTTASRQYQRSHHTSSPAPASTVAAAAARSNGEQGNNPSAEHLEKQGRGGQERDDAGAADYEEDDEELDPVELVITQDGGVVPTVSAAAVAATEPGSPAGSGAKVRLRSEHGSPCASTTAVGSAAVGADRQGAARCDPGEGKASVGSKVKHRNRKAKRSTGAGDMAVSPGVTGGGGDGARGSSGVRSSQAPASGKDSGRALTSVGGGPKLGVVEMKEGVKGEGGEVDAGEKEIDQGEEQHEEGEEEKELPPDIVLTLDDDVLHGTMLYLQPEDIVECRAVSSRWEFPLAEPVFEELCRKTYLTQSAKKMLNVQLWRSWRRMFKLRPRLRTTGMYRYLEDEQKDERYPRTRVVLRERVHWQGGYRIKPLCGDTNSIRLERSTLESESAVGGARLVSYRARRTSSGVIGRACGGQSRAVAMNVNDNVK